MNLAENIAETFEGTESTGHKGLVAGREGSNIINLSEQGLFRYSPTEHPLQEDFRAYHSSPLNEW